MYMHIYTNMLNVSILSIKPHTHSPSHPLTPTQTWRHTHTYTYMHTTTHKHTRTTHTHTGLTGNDFSYYGWRAKDLGGRCKCICAALVKWR